MLFKINKNNITAEFLYKNHTFIHRYKTQKLFLHFIIIMKVERTVNICLTRLPSHRPCLFFNPD